ncbi:MAG: hypothetical protein E7049_06970 [Lentisphaerae bacterium]|nr:hypothetical protein [Lentisphaerota bacterium]
MKLAIALLAGVLSVSADAMDRVPPSVRDFSPCGGRIRAALLDLAKQPETPEFVSRWMERVSSYGVNTVVLYLKGRASTSVFSMQEGEGYSPDEMRAWAKRADELGIALVPAVSLLGHADQFFADGKHDAFCEERSDGYPDPDAKPQTFCLSNPATRDFLERHVAELCEIFPGPYFHVGFDEAWNMGRCARCAPLAASDGGDSLFASFVGWTDSVCRRNGKRMMMWDDFLGFHRGAIEKIPRDIVMVQWNYGRNISTLGPRFNFHGHERTDWLSLYGRLGFDAMTACWFSSENMRTLANYDRRHKSVGFLVTQWEELMFSHHGGSLPRILARVLMDEEPSRWQLHDAFEEAVRRVFPSLTQAEVLAAAEILESAPPRAVPESFARVTCLRRGVRATADALAVELLKASALKPGSGEVDDDPLCERALLDDIVLRGETGLAHESFVRCSGLLTDPRRTQEDVDEAVAMLKEVRRRLAAIRERRIVQSAKWRQGKKDRCATLLDDSIGGIDAILGTNPGVAAADEKRLELCLTLVDFYGRPSWTVSGRFSGEWRELAKGGWKPGDGEWAAFSRFATFSSAEMPTEVKVEYDGSGEASLRYVLVEGRDAVARPVRLVSAKGEVAKPGNLLRDDFSEAVFGNPDGIGAFLHPERRVKSEVVLGMGE